MADQRACVETNSFDPRSENYVLAEVRAALHVKPTNWTFCGTIGWTDAPTSILPVMEHLIASGISLWIYSEDMDANVTGTATRCSINRLKLRIKTPWRPWNSYGQVAGYVTGYKGLKFATVRGAGHLVPTYQRRRALTLISSFLQGTLPPSFPDN